MAHLFSDAEVFEDNVQDLLCSDPSSDPAQAGESLPDALGCQGQVHVTVALVLSQGRAAPLQVGPVAGLGQTGGTSQRVGTTTARLRRKSETLLAWKCLYMFVEIQNHKYRI